MLKSLYILRNWWVFRSSCFLWNILYLPNIHFLHSQDYEEDFDESADEHEEEKEPPEPEEREELTLQERKEMEAIQRAMAEENKRAGTAQSRQTESKEPEDKPKWNKGLNFPKNNPV